MAHTVVTLACMTVALVALVEASSSFYTDNYLGQSIPIGRVEPRQQKEVEKELLELMGLYSKPKSKSNEKIVKSASKFMRELYESLKELDAMEQSADDSHIHINSAVNASALGLDPAKVEGADVIVSFVNQEHSRKGTSIRHSRDSTFYFDFSEVSVGEQMKGAELRLYKEVSQTYKSGTFTLKLFAIRQGPDAEDRILELESSLNVDWDKSGWLILDATRAAQNWTFFPHQNMGLYLKVVDSYGREHDPEDIGIVSARGSADKQSFLVGYMAMTRDLLSRRTRSLRSKRWADKDDVSYSDNPYAEHSRTGFAHYRAHNNCQRHNLYINFREIGFDNEFLIAPEGYSAFYCAGDCSFPLGIHMNATNHAIVQTLVHLMEPYNVPKPCCAPTKFGTITLLYYDDNASVVLKRFREMIVKACGCH